MTFGNSQSLSSQRLHNPPYHLPTSHQFNSNCGGRWLRSGVVDNVGKGKTNLIAFTIDRMAWFPISMRRKEGRNSTVVQWTLHVSKGLRRHNHQQILMTGSVQRMNGKFQHKTDKSIRSGACRIRGIFAGCSLSLKVFTFSGVLLLTWSVHPSSAGVKLRGYIIHLVTCLVLGVQCIHVVQQREMSSGC